jgi:peptidyl-lysine (3S)-dioxygenase / protease
VNAKMMNAQQISEMLEAFSQEVSQFEHPSQVPRLTARPTADLFRAEYVERSRPCVLAGAAATWPAVRKWSLQHLVSNMGVAEVTCTFTPDGAADAVKRLSGGGTGFVLPHTERRTLRSFADVFRQTQQSAAACVPSVQFQNGNMEEFAQLAQDVAMDMDWATRAFGTGPPDARNIWIGDSRSVTSFHKVLLTPVQATVGEHRA